jgi:hypothetical protein
MLNNAFAVWISLPAKGETHTGQTIDKARSMGDIGIVILIITLPIIIYYIQSRWPKSDCKLPYYANGDVTAL